VAIQKATAKAPCFPTLLLQLAALRANPAKRHIVTSQVEHSSVLNYCVALEKQSQDSPQSIQTSQGTAPQSASVFSEPSVVDGFARDRPEGILQREGAQ
jgi:hypothetical protein